jgi:HEAT repeat protein
VIAVRDYSLTDAERRRIEHIDTLVLGGASSAAELVELLSETSWTVRRAVIGALAALGDEAAVLLCAWLRHKRTSEHAIAAAVEALASSIGRATSAAVIALLGEQDPAVVADAAVILGRRRAAEAVSHLVRLLEHADDNVAVAAIEALGEIGGSAAIDGLIDVVRKRQFFRTFPALHVLAACGDPRAITPLLELFEDELFRGDAVRALGQTGSAHAIEPLAARLAVAADLGEVRLLATALAQLIARAEWSGAGGVVRAALRAAIAPARQRFVAALSGAAPDERIALAGVLGEIGDGETLAVLIALLPDQAAGAAAAQALEKLAVHNAGALLDELQRGDAATRAALLRFVSDRGAGPRVCALLADEDPDVRTRACEALGRIGDPETAAALFGVLRDPNPGVAHAAVAAIHALDAANTALGAARTALGATRTAALAIDALRDADPAVRRHALRIIARLGADEAFEPVRDAIGDPDPRIRELAVSALGALTDPRVDAILEVLARRPHDATRAAAMRAAAHRGSEAMAALLARGLSDDSAWVRYYACQGLGRLGHASSTSALIARLADAYPHVRVAAIEALARLDTPQAWQALTSAVRSDDADEHRAALVGISHEARPRALPFLLDAWRSPELATRLIALAGLARLTDGRALEPLAAAAGGDDRELRDAALSLLEERSDRAAAEILVDVALAADLAHPVHAALARPSAARIAAIGARLVGAAHRPAQILAAALGRMGGAAATAALFAALSMPSAAARLAAATVLIAIDAGGAREVVARLAAEDPDLDVRGACLAAVRGPRA